MAEGIGRWFPGRGGRANALSGDIKGEHAAVMFSPNLRGEVEAVAINAENARQFEQQTTGPIVPGDPRQKGAVGQAARGAASGAASVARHQGVTYGQYVWGNKLRSRWTRWALPSLALAHLATIGSYNEGAPKVIDEVAENILRSPGLLGFLAGVAEMTMVDANFQRRQSLEEVTIPAPEQPQQQAETQDTTPHAEEDV